ncbi:MAG: hypothetical protein ACI4UV_09130 [Victivallales bacterium]
MSFFSEGLEAQEEFRAQFMTDAAIYRRGDRECAVGVTPGETFFRTSDGNGASTVIRAMDFILAASEIDGIGTPKRGDQILYCGRRYEVLNPGGEPCWQWSDAERRIYRIHTKDTGGTTER